MELLIELLKYIMPSAILLTGVYIIFDKFLKQEERKEAFAIRQNTMKELIPLKLQAYERSILFLERLSPENLLLRLPPANQPAGFYRQRLTQEIQSEYEHNMSQQLYMDSDSWVALKGAKDQIVGLINSAERDLNENANDFDLAQGIMKKLIALEVNPSASSISVIKSDVVQNLKLIR